VRRREFIALAGGAAAWPAAARAQEANLPTIGFVSSSKLELYPESSLAAFHRGLGETGYVDGQNVAVDYRVADDQSDRLPALVAELVRRRVAVIVTANSLPPANAAKAATTTIPIVFLMGADPVENNLVVSLARPGGNVTGVTVIAGDLFEKRLGLLHELVPTAGLIGYFVNPTNPAFTKFARKVPPVARALGVEVLELNASTPIEVEEAFASLTRRRIGALLVGPDAFFMAQRQLLVAQSARHVVSYFRREFVQIGGLMSYQAKIDDAYHQVGVYVGRILKGEKPSDLPVLQPTKFELVLNLKTAKALGLTVPALLLARADEVIE
jgi:putative tryptophan/tyrosine transport system substrate-binding protein